MSGSKGFKRLFEMQQGIFYTNLLHQGIELKVFDYLSLGSTSDEVSLQICTHPQSTLYFLRGLAAAGLLKVKGQLFSNTELSEKYLVTGSENYLGDYLENHSKWNNPVFESFEKILKSGPVIPEKPADDEEIWAAGASAMINFQRTCTGPALGKIIKEIPGINSTGRMLDLGGGPGLNACKVLKENPAMTGTLFDRPAVIEVARPEIEKAGMEKRLSTMGGDFAKDDFGSNWNLITATCCLNFVKDNIETFTKRIFDALSPEGFFVSIHDGLTHNKTQPQSIALSWMPVSLMFEDLGMEKGMIRNSMENAGFQIISSKSIDFGFGPMELDIAKKNLGKDN